jgi:hypothetical protein
VNSVLPFPLLLGKWDEKNEAHVGGNQWQGGTGGSDTAGLGGRGGPVRTENQCSRAFILVPW